MASGFIFPACLEHQQELVLIVKQIGLCQHKRFSSRSILKLFPLEYNSVQRLIHSLNFNICNKYRIAYSLCPTLSLQTSRRLHACCKLRYLVFVLLLHLSHTYLFSWHTRSCFAHSTVYRVSSPVNRWSQKPFKHFCLPSISNNNKRYEK